MYMHSFRSHRPIELSKLEAHQMFQAFYEYVAANYVPRDIAETLDGYDIISRYVQAMPWSESAEEEDPCQTPYTKL